MSLYAIAIIVVLALLTVHQNNVWSSEVSLWGNAVRHSPEKLRPRVALGYAQQRAGDAAAAAKTYGEALKLSADTRQFQRDPLRAATIDNLSLLLMESGQFPIAEDILVAGLQEYPESLGMTNKLANLYTSTGRAVQAIFIAKSLIDRNPYAADITATWFRLYEAYAAAGDCQEARDAHNHAVSTREHASIAVPMFACQEGQP